MPIYEYQCKKCGEFELMQRITDAPLTRCPTCRGKVTKLISNTSFQLKGSGWYATDYARKDLAYALELAREAGVEAEGARVAQKRLDAASAGGFGRHYWPVILNVVDPDAT